ncbi:MAG: STAS/SEC14 domain-containing protein [Roseibium sp.]
MYKILPRSNGPVLGIEVFGKLTIDQERELIAKAEELLELHPKVSFLVVLGEHVGVSFEAATADIKWIATHLNKIKRLAILTDSTLLAALIAVDSTFSKLAGIEEKHFDKNDIEAAWDWIERD